MNCRCHIVATAWQLAPMAKMTINAGAIRAAAHALRSELGVQNQFALDFPDILKRLKTQVKVVSAENAPALAWTDAKTLHIQKSVFERLAQGDVHARYIVAHEIGHIVLNHQAQPTRHTNRAMDTSWQRLEIEAALFANELLMPTSLMRQFQTADEISAKFHVSRSAAQNRIVELASAEELPLAPATRARADVISELVDRGYSESEISELVVPKRTLARRRADNELLTVEETDKALRLSRIAKQATRVFGDPAKAHRWLRKPKRALNGETPVAFLASEEGARKVEEMLHRIDHGMAA